MPKMTKPDLSIDTDLARKILTGFIHSEITRMGFSHAVIALSGGIDSALSCFLAAEALGPENVLAVRMPYQSSSADFTGRCAKSNRGHWRPISDHTDHCHG
jgi:NAD+ synthase